MPDTPPWRALIDGQHEDPPPISVGTVDQIDAMVAECAHWLGFTLEDRTTLEAAVLGASLGRYIHTIVYEQNREVRPDRSTLDHEITICDGLARWLLVERVLRMVPDG